MDTVFDDNRNEYTTDPYLFMSMRYGWNRSQIEQLDMPWEIVKGKRVVDIRFLYGVGEGSSQEHMDLRRKLGVVKYKE